MLLAAWWPAQASEAPIRSVVLYPGMAIVQRALEVSAGAQHVEIEGLPTDFDVDSLRVEGSAGLHVGQLTLKQEARVARPDSREAQLEDRLQALTDREADLGVDAQAAVAVRDLVGRLTPGFEGGKGGSVLALDGRSLGGIFEQVRRTSAESAATIRRVDVQKRELDQQIEAARRDLDTVRSGRRDTRVLRFYLAAERAGQLRISYPQGGAGWRPAYRAELDSASGKVILRRQAQVHQRTGEDWSGVSLRLSTGRPQLSLAGPEPQTWQLWLAQVQDRRGGVAADAPVAFATMAAPAATPAPSSALQKAAPPPEFELYQAPFATEFSMPVPVSLPSDGSLSTLTLGEQALDAAVRLRAVPRLDAVAYVEAEAQRPQGDWLPGQVQLVRDGDFVGQTSWDPQAGEKMLLPFGRDDLVQVHYERVQDRRGSAGVLSSRQSREVTEVYTISSRHSAAMQFLVLESAPVSADDKIKVEKEFTPAADEQDWQSKPGVAAWKLALQPGQKATLRAHYTISYPGDRAVIGLP